MLKKKVTKTTKFVSSKLNVKERKSLVCQSCSLVTVMVSNDISAVTCAYCVQKTAEPPKLLTPKPESEKFPRGWHFKQRYVHTDGRVFCKGVETSEVETPKTSKKKKVVKKKTPKKRK